MPSTTSPDLVDLPPDQQLCTQCGLCCDGSLFVRVPLRPDEVDRAAAQGVPVIDEGAAFSLPCGKLRDCRCMIYAERPTVCAAFRCALLERLDRGAIDLATAQSTVRTARTMTTTLRDRLPVGTDLASARGQAAHFLRYGAAHPTNRLSDELVAETVAMMMFLDRHFRREGKTDLEPEMGPGLAVGDRPANPR